MERAIAFRSSPWVLWQRSVLGFLRKKPLGAAGALVVLMMILVALLAPLLATHDYTKTDATATFRPPSAEHWMGTDKLGRDVYSRIVYGARISLAVGLGATLLGAVVGGLLGLLSGYWRGWFDLGVQRVLDVLQAFPLLVLALVTVAALGPSLINVIFAISIPIIPRVARVVRSSTLSVREWPFVEAARALGAGDLRILWVHIFPNTLGPFIVMVTAQLGSAILVEASLSFLGLGVPEPHPSWGRMLAGSAAEYVQRAPWLVVFPGLAISLAVFGFNLMGDALRDVLDPRLRRAR